MGDEKTIFVGSSCDIWAYDIPYKWIERVMQHCWKYDNVYLLQTKNPSRITDMETLLPTRTIIGTTIETNRAYPEMGNAPPTSERAEHIMWFGRRHYITEITIEPIMDFDIDQMLTLIGTAKPNFVNIGANTNRKVNLPEPTNEKLKTLIFKLEQTATKVKLKSNLLRLLK